MTGRRPPERPPMRVVRRGLEPWGLALLLLLFGVSTAAILALHLILASLG